MKLYISKDCKSCEYVLEHITNSISPHLKIDTHIVREEKKLKTYILLDEKGADIKAINLPSVPVLIDGKMVIVGTGIVDYLFKKMDNLGLASKFKPFGLLTITAAGLIDGINPCAFATIVFFISLLSCSAKRKGEILRLGFYFILGVFCTYFLIGLGCFKMLNSFKTFILLSKVLYYTIVLSVGILGIVSLYDFFIYAKTRDARNMKLRLPTEIIEKIHGVIEKNLQTKRLFIFIFFTGIVISLLELGCTGQIYLPTLVFMAKEPIMQMRPYFYLLLYNIMFIIPLLAITVLGCLGVSIFQLNRLSNKNIALSKFLSAVFFFGLAAIMMVRQV